MKFQYSVRYRRSGDLRLRVYRLTVVASSPDEARARAAIRDPEFASTTETPRRGKVVADVGAFVQEPRCRICKGELGNDWGRFTDGGFYCWRCREKADLPEDQPEFVTVDGGRFGDIEVEWT